MGRRSLRSYYYALFALIILVMSWESSLASAALITPTIPEESIRIRILANSDSVEDQWIKKEIREVIVASINSWDQSYATIDEARAVVHAKLPELESVVAEQLRRYGFSYGYHVELGQVEFPAKAFGSETYPAGMYEALRITLGAGKGENWWCVLFPPLCFGNGTVKAKSTVKAEEKLASSIAANGAEEEAGKSDKSAKKDDNTAEGKVKDQAGKSGNSESKVTEGKSGNVERKAAASNAAYSAPIQEGEEVEVRFFLVDAGKKVGKFFKSLFS